jgi:SAM-dependent methyltransferase
MQGWTALAPSIRLVTGRAATLEQQKLTRMTIQNEIRRLLVPCIAWADLRLARRKLLSDTSVPDADKALLDKVSLRIHRDDGMYSPSDARHYLSVGLSAVRCIQQALERTNGNRSVESILDLPCGYGRMLRFLRVRFPKADITASEIDTSPLDFCEDAFAVRTARSDKDFRKLSLSGRFDLIWCGSLVTHLDERATSDLLAFFHDHLSPGGLCVVTTHGRLTADWMEKRLHTYGLTPSAQRQVLSQFRDNGYGYADYENWPGYGISVVSRERMLALARDVGRWNESSFFERGWDNHQDVYAFTRCAE